jgi:Peptidase family C25
MGAFLVIRPGDDAAARQAAEWCSELADRLVAAGHELIGDVDELTPAHSPEILTALQTDAELVCYFGHGASDSWRTDDLATIDSANVGVAAGKVVISVACLTGRGLGPDAITAGVRSWLGFTIKIPVIAPHVSVDPIGEAFANGLAGLAGFATIGDVRDALIAAFAQLADDYDEGGRFAGHPAQAIGYYGALALQDHITVDGSRSQVPLS